MSKTLARKPIEIKISTVVAIVAILHETNLTILNGALFDLTNGNADYFDDEFAVVDLSPIDPLRQLIDWTALIALFKSFRLNLVAVRNAAPSIEASIQAHGLSIDVVARGRENLVLPEPASPVPPPAPVVVAAPAPAPVPAPNPGAMIIDTPVRAGQRIYAQGCDLIVTAVVNNGAELIADGSIHIYAPLRGRALAGARGHHAARIFSLSMEAELVSIAGIYRTFEDGVAANVAGGPAQVILSGDRIEVLSLGASASR